MRSRILHIDDDPAMLEVVALVLSRDPTLETRGCLTGEEGLRAAVDWLPDLILSDVSMPDLDGLEVFEKLRENELTSGIPVVFTTACGRIDDVGDYLASGVAGIIVKPFKLRELIDSVREYLDMAEAEPIELTPPDIGIGKRLQDDADRLAQLRADFASQADPSALREVVHKLAGVAGVYGFGPISEAAASIELKLVALTRKSANRSDVLTKLDELLGLLDRENLAHPKP
ncbi:MAG: response regulator [Rhodopseudomonas palustris]|uniref:Response regulator n=1 Tax=Rhodopseudomonas palustris TaxID=1076 RepID=A0A933RYH2_RHOPL|nr:response regulator [Rhodopseudomonas palustris]